MSAKSCVFALLAAYTLFASRSEYLSVQQKFRSIQAGRSKPGARIPIPSNELNAYVQTELPKVAPQGIRQPNVELIGNNMARARAYINFVKLQQAGGEAPGWLARNILSGEREVVVTAQLSSSRGKAEVHLTRVEVGGIPVEGAALDFLVRNYVVPKYPEAKLDRPFELDYNMDRLEVAPGVAYVVLR